MLCDIIGPHIIGYVAFHILAHQAKIAAIDLWWNGVGGMIAGDEPARRARFAQEVERGVCHMPVISLTPAIGAAQLARKWELMHKATEMFAVT